MGVEVQWKNERGEILASLADPGVFVQMSGLLSRQTGSTCLRFIHPSGDACFNQLQLPHLSMELRNLLASIENTRWQRHLQEVLALVEGASAPHTYVWFLGD